MDKRNIFTSTIFLFFIFALCLGSCVAPPETATDATYDTDYAPPKKEYPTIFVHGHGNDVWAWQPMIERVKGSRQVYRNGEAFYAGDEIKGTYDKNSIWNFGYYKERYYERDQYPYYGRIGGIPIKRTNKMYNVLGDVYVRKADCTTLYYIGGACDPNQTPITVEDTEYESRVSYADQLRRAVDKILAATGAEKVNIVAHSMGGLVARSYIKWLGGNDKVYRILTVGTPNHGVSDLGEHIMQFGLIVGIFGGMNPDPDWQKIGEDIEMYPKAVDDYHFDKTPNDIPLYDGKSFIQQLNDGGMIVSPVQYATIAGDYHDIVLSSFELLGIDHLKRNGVPADPQDDVVVNIREVQIEGAEFNTIVHAAHGRPEKDKDLKGINDPDLLLTESGATASIIGRWILGDVGEELAPDIDYDGDGISNLDDNCPAVANPDQANRDGDYNGDACDPDPDIPYDAISASPLSHDIGEDDDQDGIVWSVDNCLYVYNPDQVNTDSDYRGDACDPDDDNDGVKDINDLFPLDPKEWIDTDKDGTGDNADLDDDGDGLSDQIEASLGSNPLDPSSKPIDTDDDGLPDLLDPDDDNDGVLDQNDAFPLDPSESIDTDGDKIGNNVDTDDDGDGYSDELEDMENTDPLNPLSKPSDIDKDGIPDSTDTDIDGDSYENTKDIFPLNPREWLDTDGDGIGNNADTDDDGDLYTDAVEIQVGSDPLDLNSKPADHDGDFIPDSMDPDDDNDGVLDVDDPSPFDPAVSVDTDGDGIDDRIDTDDDNDGYSDVMEISCGANHLDANSKPADNDKDGTPDILDSDDDNDGVPDLNDAFPFDPGESLDSDGDGIGNNADTDDDGDGYVDVLEIQFGTDPLNSASKPKDFDKDGNPDSTDSDDDNDTYVDSNDLFPYDKTEWADFDRDGIGDNRDLDDDNDGYPDSVEIDEGTNPFDANSKPNDLDKDLIPDSIDDDIDGDGYLNQNDVFPRDPSEWSDFDRDGVGDNADPDDDNDEMPDWWELQYGLNPKYAEDASMDKDGDGIRNDSEYAHDTDPTNHCDPIQYDFCYYYDIPDAGTDAGQCRLNPSEALGERCVPLGSWSQKAIVDTDGRPGWCEQRFIIRTKFECPSNLEVCMDFMPVGWECSMDIGLCTIGRFSQCRNPGTHCAKANTWTSTIGLDMDDDRGWCEQQFFINGPPQFFLEMEFSGSTNGQCKNMGTSTANTYGGKTANIGLNTNSQPGGCDVRWRLGKEN
ncbi:MAG: alpha/beta fold hydrolase [Pseudomonadota bacterium]